MLIELIPCPRRLIEDDICVVISGYTENMTVRGVVRVYEGGAELIIRLSTGSCNLCIYHHFLLLFRAFS